MWDWETGVARVKTWLRKQKWKEKTYQAVQKMAATCGWQVHTQSGAESSNSSSRVRRCQETAAAAAAVVRVWAAKKQWLQGKLMVGIVTGSKWQEAMLISRSEHWGEREKKEKERQVGASRKTVVQEQVKRKKKKERERLSSACHS